MKKAVIITLVAGFILFFGWAVFNNSQSPEDSQTPARRSVAPDVPGAPGTALPQEDDASAEGPSALTAAESQTTEPKPLPTTKLSALRVAPVTNSKPAVLGDPEGGDSPYNLIVSLHHYGAGISKIQLTDYKPSVQSPDDAHYLVASELEIDKGKYARLYPYAARALWINDQKVDLQTQRWDLENAGVSSATYRLTILDAGDVPVCDVVRTYSLEPDNYEVTCDQQIINRYNQPLRVVWEQNLQGDIASDTSYLGDRRMIVAGYLQPGQTRAVYARESFKARLNVINDLLEDPAEPYWPPTSDLAEADMVWLGTVNRYFAMVTHQPLDNNIQPLVALFPEIEVQAIGKPSAKAEEHELMVTARSRELYIAPNDSVDLDLALFAGPRLRDLFEAPPYKQLSFGEMVIYELGCTFCTFQPLARGLLWFLNLLHDYVVFDWGVAIIVLVIVVRAILHPITKKSQVNMMKMGKQMQQLKPEMEKIKKKYADNSAKMNQEVMALYREKGVNPANMLGCLPMFLQMPIWVALYAMLYFAIELRHQPAFYGIFQSISGGSWQFLADLSSADHFIKFEKSFEINFLFLHLTFGAINVLPLLWAVAMFFQQKLTQPPPADEQAAQQQKIMKYMSVLFPFFLYSAPSGLTLYILASTCAGILDSYIVRKHVKQQEEAGLLFQPAKPRKPGGFMDRLSKAMEQAMQQAQQKKQEGGDGKPPKRRK